MLRSLVLEIEKSQTNKTSMASRNNFNAHLGVFWGNLFKIMFLFQYI